MATYRLLRQSLRSRSAIVSVVAIAGIGTFYGALLFFTPMVYAESTESPKIFGGFGFTTLRLQDVKQANHNTKRSVFEFPDPNAKSGLTLTCMFAIVETQNGCMLMNPSGFAHLFVAQRAVVPRAPSIHPDQRSR